MTTLDLGEDRWTISRDFEWIFIWLLFTVYGHVDLHLDK